VTSDQDKPGYNIKRFSAAIKGLRRRTPKSDKFPIPSGYTSLQHQWLEWLEEYLEPGYYDRKNVVDDARWAYQHLNNGNMIIWLNEAAGEDSRMVQAAIVAIHGRDSRQTEAMYARRVFPWDQLATRLFGE
jgi:hypothetical protein